VLAVASLGIQSEVGQYFKTLGEPHSADPLAMWCGEGREKLPLTRLTGFFLYTIVSYFYIRNIHKKVYNRLLKTRIIL